MYTNTKKLRYPRRNQIMGIDRHQNVCSLEIKHSGQSYQ